MLLCYSCVLFSCNYLSLTRLIYFIYTNYRDKFFFKVSSRMIILHINRIKWPSLKENIWYHLYEGKRIYSVTGKNGASPSDVYGRWTFGYKRWRRKADGRGEKWRKRKFKFREGEELARRIREATNHGLGVSVGWTEGSLRRWKRGCRGLGKRGRGVNSGVAAITGMVESE